MSAPFVALALSYCLGLGKIKLLGQKKRPWLEIIRPETDLTYLIHQSRQLHKYHDGKLNLEIDTVGTESFYDDKRLRCHGEALYRAYELLYPRDQRTLTPEVLSLTGHRGVAALWCDRGRVKRQEFEIICRARSQVNSETELILQWLQELGYKPNPARSRPDGGRIRFTGSGADDFASKMRQLLPRHRLHTLRR